MVTTKKTSTKYKEKKMRNKLKCITTKNQPNKKESNDEEMRDTEVIRYSKTK